MFIEKFQKGTWEKELGRKKKYNIEEFNRNHNHHQKAYIRSTISWRAKIIIAQISTNLHQLCCHEAWRWKRPKEMWEDGVCTFFSSGKMGTEKNFILECEAFKDNTESYAHILVSIPWDIIFSMGFVKKS